MIITGDAKLYGKKYQDVRLAALAFLVADHSLRDMFADVAADGAFDVFFVPG